MKRLVIIFTLVAVVALPFVLRPKRVSLGQAEDTLVVISPHNEAIRSEFARGFAIWYKAKTGRTVAIDWRVVGGSSEIARFIEGEFTTAFENHWVRKLGKPWSAEIQAGFQATRLAPDAPALVREAWTTFRASEVGCGIDVFFGGGTYDLDRQARAGRLVDSGVMKRHPEWFTEATIPRRYAGEDFRHADGLWIGTVLSSYGIIFNRDALARAGFVGEPKQWVDLAHPSLRGEVALADPTKSSSVAKAFENIIQQQMQRALTTLRTAEPAAEVASLEARAVDQGWVEGLRLLQRIGANARYFTDTSQKPPIDVASGNCAAGLCIDFYGRQQQEAVRRRGESDRIGYISPVGGSVASVDPMALFRGAKNRAVGEAFIEFVLSMDGQKLWNFKTGVEGGPSHFVLRRLPVRRDFYAQADWKPLVTDPNESPFEQQDALVYREAWTSPLFREMAVIIRIMCQDTHVELKSAWQAILAAPEPQRAKALAVFQDVERVSYAKTKDEVRRRLGSKDKVDEVKLAKELADYFRANYARAEAIARGGGGE